MSKKKQTRQILFENGTVAFADKGSGFALKAADGGEVKIVDERPVPEGIDTDKPSMLKAEPKGKGWQTRPKTGEELVREGRMTSEQAENYDRERREEKS